MSCVPSSHVECVVLETISVYLLSMTGRSVEVRSPVIDENVVNLMIMVHYTSRMYFKVVCHRQLQRVRSLVQDVELHPEGATCLTANVSVGIAIAIITLLK